MNVSYDGVGATYEGVRGFDGAAVAERAMAMLQAAGVPFGVNVVLTRGSFDALPATLARAEALGAREAQLLRYKPAGRAASIAYLEARLTPEQVDRLPRVLEEQSRARSLSLRVDCALVPLLSGGDLDLDAERLARFGVFGCEAGRHLEALDITGAPRPCSFAPEEADAVAWREPPNDAPCASCSLRTVCRGGCKVVARHVTGDLGPDPECPRVRRFRVSPLTRNSDRTPRGRGLGPLAGTSKLRRALEMNDPAYDRAPRLSKSAIRRSSRCMGALRLRRSPSCLRSRKTPPSVRSRLTARRRCPSCCSCCGR